MELVGSRTGKTHLFSFPRLQFAGNKYTHSYTIPLFQYSNRETPNVMWGSSDPMIIQVTNCWDQMEQIRQSPENSGLALMGISFDNPMFRT